MTIEEKVKRAVDEIVLVCHGYLDCAADNQNLRDRLDGGEAERDAVQKRVLDCETRTMRYAIELAEMQAERDAARAGAERLREDAARNRWCEEMKADVNYGFHSGGVYVHEWFVQWDGIGTAHCVRHPDRNAAIDAARGVR